MPAADATQAFARVLADELVRHGVTDAVVAPGSRSTPVALALWEDERVRVHVRIDERSAAFLALGLARGSGRPVPVLCTSGTATAHLHAAALEADAGRVPVLLLTADRPPELRGVGANQTVEQPGMFGAAARWAVDVGVPEARPEAVGYWRSLVSRAIAAAVGASGGAAGPVQLNLPLREPLIPTAGASPFPFELAGRAGGAPWTAAVRAPAPVPAALADLLAAVRRGVVVAGDGLTDADADAVVAYAGARRWPLVAEPHSNCRRGPTALRATDAVLRDAGFATARAPELVLVAGRVGLSRATQEWLGAQRYVVIDRDGSWWDPLRRAELVVRADAAGLADLATSGAAVGDARWAHAWSAAAGAAGAAVDAVLDSDGALCEPQVARDVAAWLPDGATLVVASSMPIRDLDLTLQPRAGLRIVANRGVSGIDGFVSTACGVAWARRDAGPTVALAGDLSLLHDVNGLLADPQPPLTVVVVNNDGGGIFSLLPQGQEPVRGFEPLFGTPHGVDLAGVATAYGVEHRRVDSRAALRAAVSEPPAGLRLVEVRTDRAANAQLHRRLTAAAAEAVAAGA